MIKITAQNDMRHIGEQNTLLIYCSKSGNCMMDIIENKGCP
jgi:hypothetical protein